MDTKTEGHTDRSTYRQKALDSVTLKDKGMRADRKDLESILVW